MVKAVCNAGSCCFSERRADSRGSHGQFATRAYAVRLWPLFVAGRLLTVSSESSLCSLLTSQENNVHSGLGRASRRQVVAGHERGVGGAL